VRIKRLQADIFQPLSAKSLRRFGIALQKSFGCGIASQKPSELLDSELHDKEVIGLGNAR
jgi:hypothetical protein